MSDVNKLKRSLGLLAVIFYGVGAILGAGIYVLVGEVSRVAGYFSPLSFLLAALIALFSALSYIELSVRFPRSAGEAVYVSEAFALRWLTQLIGLLVVATGVVSAATMATGVVGYFQLFFSWRDSAVIVLFIAIVGAIAIWGIKQSAWAVATITLIEVAGLLYVIFISAENIVSFPALITAVEYNAVDSVVTGIFLGGFLAFYAYIGFEDIVNIAEEIKRPAKVLPKAILYSFGIATLLYVAVSIAALSVLSPQQLASSSAPLAEVVRYKGHDATWIGAISLLAVSNGAIVQLIMGARVLYGMAAKGLLPKPLARINSMTSTPIIASVVCIILTLLLALLFPLGGLAQATSIIVLIIFAVVNLALIKLTRELSDDQQTLYPHWVPYIGLMLCAMVFLLKPLL
jgi:amino acid transporter